MNRALPIVAMLAIAIPPFAQNSQLGAQSADFILTKAKAQAAKENKNILVKFSASWCTWCHRMDDWLKKTDEGKMVADQYILVTLIVDEDENHAAEENPGADDFRKTIGGDQLGIPFFAILDKNGKMLINSNPKGKDEKPSNIGFPVEDFEIAHFMKMVKTTSKLNSDQLKKTQTSLEESAKKIKGGG